jgi:hypothetical protein
MGIKAYDKKRGKKKSSIKIVTLNDTASIDGSNFSGLSKDPSNINSGTEVVKPQERLIKTISLDGYNSGGTYMDLTMIGKGRIFFLKSIFICFENTGAVSENATIHVNIGKKSGGSIVISTIKGTNIPVLSKAGSKFEFIYNFEPTLKFVPEFRSNFDMDSFGIINRSDYSVEIILNGWYE